jgi:hypothetical protein
MTITMQAVIGTLEIVAELQTITTIAPTAYVWTATFRRAHVVVHAVSPLTKEIAIVMMKTIYVVVIGTVEIVVVPQSKQTTALIACVVIPILPKVNVQRSAVNQA